MLIPLIGDSVVMTTIRLYIITYLVFCLEILLMTSYYGNMLQRDDEIIKFKCKPPHNNMSNFTSSTSLESQIQFCSLDT